MGCKPGDVFVHVSMLVLYENQTDLLEEHRKSSELTWPGSIGYADLQYQLEDDSVNSLLDYGVMTVGCTHGMSSCRHLI
jgi:hypothetical protein